METTKKIIGTIVPYEKTSEGVGKLTEQIRERIKMFKALGYLSADLSVGGIYSPNYNLKDEPDETAVIHIREKTPPIEHIHEFYPRIMPIKMVPIISGHTSPFNMEPKVLESMGIYELQSDPKDIIIPDVETYPTNIIKNPGLCDWAPGPIEFVFYTPGSNGIFNIPFCEYILQYYGTPKELVKLPVLQDNGTWLVDRLMPEHDESHELSEENVAALDSILSKWTLNPGRKKILLKWIYDHTEQVNEDDGDFPLVDIPCLHMRIPRSEILEEIKNISIMTSIVESSVHQESVFGEDEEDCGIIPGAIGGGLREN